MNSTHHSASRQVLPVIRPIAPAELESVGNPVTRTASRIYTWLTEVPEPGQQGFVAYQSGVDLMGW